MKTGLHWLGVGFGSTGTVLCLASLAVVWTYFPVAKERTEEICASIDQALVQVKERIDMTRERVAGVNAMTAQFRSNLQEWLSSQQFDPERVSSRAERISTRLHQAGDALDFAASFLQKVRNTQRLANPFRKESDTQQLEELLGEIGKLQTRMQDAIETVDAVREQVQQSGDDAQLKAAIERALGSVVQVIETVDVAEAQLANLSDSLPQARSRAAELELQIQRDLWWMRLAASVLLPWMALGQIALSILCWRRLRTPIEA